MVQLHRLLAAVFFFFFFSAAHATFFNGACGCPPQLPPLCLPPPPPICMTSIQLPPIPVPVIQLPRIELPQISCCPACPCARTKREIEASLQQQQQQQQETEASTSDVACNNQDLLDIMKSKMTSDESSKIKIQLIEEAETRIGGRFTVVCSQGAFSFVTSTSTYCLHSQNGLNCYLFRTQ